MIGVAERAEPVSERKPFAIGMWTSERVTLTWIRDGKVDAYAIHPDLLRSALAWVRSHAPERRYGYRLELGAYLSGLAQASLTLRGECPRPDASQDGGERGREAASDLSDLLESMGVADLVQPAPCCPSCGSNQDVELVTDLPGDTEVWQDSMCGRAFRVGFPDVCGACMGTGVLTWDEDLGGGETSVHAEQCRFCGGAGR